MSECKLHNKPLPCEECQAEQQKKQEYYDPDSCLGDYTSCDHNCENCDQYSRARADAEGENEEKLQSLLSFIKNRQESCRTSLKEYTGSNKSQAEKFMAGLYRKEIAVYDDVFSWAQFFLGIERNATNNRQESKETQP